MDLSDLIDRNAAFTPEKVALRFGDASWSYAAFAERIAAAARALKSGLGIGRGDRAAVLSLNRPDTLVLLYACARLGALLVPLNWRLAVPEQLYILENASAKALFLEGAFSAVIGPARQALPELRVIGLDFEPDGMGFAGLLEAGRGDGRNPHIDFGCPLLIVYTSGTTGRPKGAVLRQEALHWNAVNSVHMHDLTARDHVLTVLPLFHVGGLNIQTTPALQFGATVTLHPRFDPAATLNSIARDRPTLTVLVPATIQALLGLPGWPDADVSSLRAVTTGSTAVPQPLIDAVTARGVPVLQVYGSTETSPIGIYTRLGGASPANSTGLPGLVSEARVVDDRGRELPPGAPGEIVIRGPTVLFGYWGDDDATAEVLRNGWYHSGDIGSRDAAGWFYVHERKRNVIISGGENIYPAEIERVLGEHPQVVDAAVIGRADPKWQEVPVAFVVRRGDGLSAEALLAYLQAHLARFKLPHEIRFVPDLPRNALGKVQHFRLREVLAASAKDTD